MCCAYGAKGTLTSYGYDCIMIPGAVTTKGTVLAPPTQCGGKGGLVLASGVATKTICCELLSINYTF
jgi:hypothetical protein